MGARVAVVVLAAALVVPLLAGRSEAAPAASDLSLSAGAAIDVLNDAAWIEGTATPDGALPESPGASMVSPYVADVAVRGLAAAYQLGDHDAARVGWAWCDWYSRHQQPNGFITDYQLTGTTVRSTGGMDSTDAYAGTFLSAVRDLYAATRDRSSLEGISAAVAQALAAIESTQDTDGLTWAKPQWHVKYLMDEAETYDGLVAASQLEAALGSPALAQRAARDASRLASGVASLWDPVTGSFSWAVDGNGDRARTNWSVLYPDAMEEVWAVAYGLGDTSQRALIMSRLATMHPDWQLPDAEAPDAAGTVSRVGYWPVAAWAMRIEGQDPSAALQSINAAAIGRAWPYTVAVAGALIVASAPPLPSLPVPVPWLPSAPGHV